jgi:hypothetical protein
MSLLSFGAMLSFGANFNAKLLDASCASSATSGGQKASAEKLEKSCAPTASTTTFAVMEKGKTYALDAKGNEMAASAMKNGSIKPDKDGDVHVSINGTMEGSSLKVDSLKGGKGD